MLKCAFAIVVVMACAFPCSAQWMQQKKEDPFDGKDLYIAVTAAASYGLGVRCEAGSDEPEIIFFTPERLEAGAAEVMNLASPKLIVIVDGDAPVLLDAKLVPTEEDKLMIMSNSAQIAELAQTMVKARKRIAVAVEAGGQKIHKTQFGIGGSRKAVSSVLQGCKPKSP